MRVAEWTFFSRRHPVYQREEGEERWPWPAAMPGLVPARYIEEPLVPGDEPYVTEPLVMEMEGYPSVVVYQTPTGRTIQRVALRTRYMRWVELGEIEQIAAEWFSALLQLSMGPYTAEDLRRMGHPYGYGLFTSQRRAAPSWRLLQHPRRIPPMGRHAYVSGTRIRGRMPDRAVVNVNTGRFLRSWSYRILQWYGGVTLTFVNVAEYAWFLAHGTIYMQAHGPWEPVARRRRPIPPRMPEDGVPVHL